MYILFFGQVFFKDIHFFHKPIVLSGTQFKIFKKKSYNLLKKKN